MLQQDVCASITRRYCVVKLFFSVGYSFHTILVFFHIKRYSIIPTGTLPTKASNHANGYEKIAIFDRYRISLYLGNDTR